jgi:hypothetical protein
MLGRYSFAMPETVARGELRPLRNPAVAGIGCMTPQKAMEDGLTGLFVPFVPKTPLLSKAICTALATETAFEEVLATTVAGNSSLASPTLPTLLGVA